MSENFIWGALIISLAIHTSILWGVYFLRVKDSERHTFQRPIEISLRPKAYSHKVFDIREYHIRPSAQLDFGRASRFEGAVPMGLGKGPSMLPQGLSYESKPDIRRRISSSHKIFIRPIQTEKINNPAYIAYCEMIRARIKEKVYENYDMMDQGEVYLTFALDPHGILVASKIISEKTRASRHLQDISIQSLQQAAPFPWFLKGMSLPEYTFNIEIQYQVSE